MRKLKEKQPRRGTAATSACHLLGLILTLQLGFGVANIRADDAPGIAPVSLETVATEAHQYPESMRVGGFDGAYREITAFPSQSFPAGRVAFWESKQGILKTTGYPIDEFVVVVTGQLETTDSNGTTHNFGPGATFVIPKGWVGEWNMKTDFKKVFVNF